MFIVFIHIIINFLIFIKNIYILGYQFNIDEKLNQKTLEILRSWPTDSDIKNAIKCGFLQASELANILAMKRRPESIMYYFSKNGLPGIYDDDDTIFNGVNDRINQNNIQDEELELSAALFTASKENLTSDDLQETDILPGCKVQLIALKKNHLHNNYIY